MTFEAPLALWLLLALPVLAGLYVLLQRRRTRAAVRYASLALIRTAMGPRAPYRRHVPPLLFLLAFGALILAIARPSAVITLPSEQRTIVLAMDVSLSMRATDVQPSRIAAAREAAKAFVQEQPSDVRIGIVAFAGSASIVQKPTSDRKDLIDAIDRLQLQLHTAIGSGIIVSLAALFPDDAAELEAANTSARSWRDGTRSAPIDNKPKAAPKKEFKAVPPGSNHSGAIILLTDGRRTTGPDPLDAAKLAADRGIKVYTVGFGNSQGTTADADGMSIYMRFDEEALKAIALATAAEYFHAGSGADLKKVYETLNARYVLEKKETEISALLCALGAALMIAAAGLSVLWFGRIRSAPSASRRGTSRSLAGYKDRRDVGGPRRVVAVDQVVLVLRVHVRAAAVDEALSADVHMDVIQRHDAITVVENAVGDKEFRAHDVDVEKAAAEAGRRDHVSPLDQGFQQREPGGASGGCIDGQGCAGAGGKSDFRAFDRNLRNGGGIDRNGLSEIVDLAAADQQPGSEPCRIGGGYRGVADPPDAAVA